MSCKEVAVEVGGAPPGCSAKAPQPHTPPPPGPAPDEDVQMADGTTVEALDVPKPEEVAVQEEATRELLYRCITCKRLAHYAHLPLPKSADDGEEYTTDDIAAYYQLDTAWKCADCVSFVYQVEHIIAWRPYPEDVVEPALAPGEVPNHKGSLPREYLVKWIGRSYRRLAWVPHMWLLATHAAKLKNFLTKGPSIELLPEPVADDIAVDEVANDFVVGGDDVIEEAERRSKSHEDSSSLTLVALADAERRIHPTWKTIDRVLDIRFWRPKRKVTKKAKAKGKRKGHRTKADSVDSDEEEEDSEPSLDEGEQQLRDDSYTLGEEPSLDFLETLAGREKRTKQRIDASDIDDIAWGFFKWSGLGYEDGKTWH